MKCSLPWLHSSLAAVFVSLALVACEQPVVEEEAPAPETNTAPAAKDGDTPAGGNLVLRVAGSSFMPYETRAVENLADYCRRLNFILYQNGEKVKSVTQIKSEEGDGFGVATMTVAPDTYKLLVLAYSGNGGSPTISDPEKVHFTNAIGYSDTFYYYGDITVAEGGSAFDLTLQRATTRVVFRLKDTQWPADMASLTFKYTGGSGYFNVLTGFGGSVNSQQEVSFDVNSGTPLPDFPLYTFMQKQTGNLRITATLYSNTNAALQERSFEVPVMYGKQTVVEGYFMTYDNSFTITGETGWEEYRHEEF